jgi:hypothetical protein
VYRSIFFLFFSEKHKKSLIFPAFFFGPRTFGGLCVLPEPARGYVAVCHLVLLVFLCILAKCA